MSRDGYLHLFPSDPTPLWPPMGKEKTGDAFDRARERAQAENREQVRRNAIAVRLRRIARAAEEYATSLETGRHQAVARAALSIAVDDLNEVNRG